MSAPQAALLMAGGRDPAFATVVNLTHFDGTSSLPQLNNGYASVGFNTGTSFTTSSTQSCFGGKSANLSNAGSMALAVNAGGSNYAIGSSDDFTIEFRIRMDTLALQNNAVKVFFDTRTTGLGGQPAISLYTSVANGSIIFGANGVDRITSGAGVLSATPSTFDAIALSRVSGTTRLFINGVSLGTYADTFAYGNNSRFGIGAANNGAGGVSGYYDEFRFSKGASGSGAGRYAANYTVATAAFPNS